MFKLTILTKISKILYSSVCHMTFSTHPPWVGRIDGSEYKNINRDAKNMLIIVFDLYLVPDFFYLFFYFYRSQVSTDFSKILNCNSSLYVAGIPKWTLDWMLYKCCSWYERFENHWLKNFVFILFKAVAITVFFAFIGWFWKSRLWQVS